MCWWWERTCTGSLANSSKGILDAVICQYQWEQGEVAVQKMQDYLSRGIRDQEDEVISPVLLLKSNYACFLEEE